MRDPKRIDRIIDIVRAHWKKYPDLRLGQIVVNAMPPDRNIDPFYVEDDVLEAGLRERSRG